LNPGEVTFQEVILPLLAEAHDRLAAQRARHLAGNEKRSSAGSG
jgi:hypothetical protein